MGVAESWKRIWTWLEEHAPDKADLIQGPAESEELASAQELFGIELPADFRELYQTMNGSDPEGADVGAYPSTDDFEEMSFCPMALEKVIREWKMQLAGENDDDRPDETSDGVLVKWWDKAWIPFAGNGAGDYYCIDMAPTATGTRGQVITHWNETGSHKILAPSLSVYLSNLADALERGDCEYDEMFGVILKEKEEIEA